MTDAPLTVEDARADREEARAAMARLELDQARGRLLPADLVRAAWERHILSVRAQLLALPRLVAPELAGLGVVEVEARLDAAMRRTLAQLAAADGLPDADALRAPPASPKAKRAASRPRRQAG